MESQPGGQRSILKEKRDHKHQGRRLKAAEEGKIQPTDAEVVVQIRLGPGVGVECQSQEGHSLLPEKNREDS